MNVTKESHDFLLRPVDPDWFEQEVIQYLEVDLRDRRVSARRERIDERLKRFLRNDNFIDYGLCHNECKKADALKRK
jgi:hypothetical protein